jgi:hypothetical protein
VFRLACYIVRPRTAFGLSTTGKWFTHQRRPIQTKQQCGSGLCPAKRNRLATFADALLPQWGRRLRGAKTGRFATPAQPKWIGVRPGKAWVLLLVPILILTAAPPAPLAYEYGG